MKKLPSASLHLVQKLEIWCNEYGHSLEGSSIRKDRCTICWYFCLNMGAYGRIFLLIGKINISQLNFARLVRTISRGQVVLEMVKLQVNSCGRFYLDLE